MTALVKFFLRIFLFTIFIFVVVNTGVLLLLGVTPNWPRDLIAKLIISFVLASMFFTIQFIRLRKMGINRPSSDQLKVCQSSVISSGLDFFQIEEKIRADKFFGKMKMTLEGTIIEIHSKLSWWSWGEKIKIEKIGSHNSKFEYKVTSAPVLKTTLVDYCRNLENMLGITHILQSKTV